MAKFMKPNRPVGIVGYGAYVPRYRLVSQEVSELWTDGNAVSPVREKSVPGLDEDVVTMSIEAGRNAKINAAAVCTGKHDTATWAALAVPGVPVFPRLLEFVATLR